MNGMYKCLQDKLFTVEATINAINARFGWYYIPCSAGNCKKQLDKKFDHYYCCKFKRKLKQNHET